jgi:hypothetical protein
MLGAGAALYFQTELTSEKLKKASAILADGKSKEDNAAIITSTLPKNV